MGMLIGAYVYLSQDVQYTAPLTIEKEVIKKVDVIESRKEDAWNERKASAKEKAQTAYEDVMLNERLESDLSVIREVQTELDEEEIQLMASSSLPEALTQ